jgi:L-seryl-tRNA(Ser) seleniumtransferase
VGRDKVREQKIDSGELRKIPSVDVLLRSADEAGVFAREIPRLRLHLTRALLHKTRELVKAGQACPSIEELLAALGRERARFWEGRLKRVINATGIPLHTNLGRAPLGKDVLAEVANLGAGYCDLEFDLERGTRGGRGAWLEESLAALTGAQAACVVNNAASAVFLAMTAVCHGKEAIVSRGELVQVGGGFRIPDVMESAGARLREVGATNIVTARDYERAVSEHTAAILKVHRSNFSVEGHVEELGIRELREIADRAKVPLIHDLGSGRLTRPEVAHSAHDPLREEMTLSDSLHAGANLVLASGDKLAGGVQAGIICGDKDLVERLRAHPVYRVVRPGRLVLAALQSVISRYLEADETNLPLHRMIRASSEELKGVAEGIRERLEREGIPCETRASVATVGGGAGAETEMPTWVVVLRPDRLEEFARRLREGPSPVVARISSGEVMLDPRTVLPEEREELIPLVASAWNVSSRKVEE